MDEPDDRISRRGVMALSGTTLAAVSAGAAAFARAPSAKGDGYMTDIAGMANQLAGHGYFLMIAEWRLKEGTLAQAKEVIDRYRPFILKADGIKIFLAAQGRDDPDHILFYEAYESEAHYKAHAASEAFQKWIIQEGLPLVAKRTLTTFTLL